MKSYNYSTKLILYTQQYLLHADQFMSFDSLLLK
jgi:hypothetical protein